MWLLGRFVRWKSYDVALTSTRILVRQGIIGRDTVQLRLQRITEVNIRQSLVERVLGTGSLVIDVQGEDDSLTLEYMRKPAVVQRVINSQINEIVGGGAREPIPADMQPHEPHPRSRLASRRSRRPRASTTRRRSARPHPHGPAHPRHRRHRVGPARASAAAAQRAVPFEIRDRLIELDDLRKRGIISEEEFAAKKSELLDRI